MARSSWDAVHLKGVKGCIEFPVNDEFNMHIRGSDRTYLAVPVELALCSICFHTGNSLLFLLKSDMMWRMLALPADACKKRCREALHLFYAIGNCVLLHKSTSCTDAQLSRAEQKPRYVRNWNARVREAHFCSSLGKTCVKVGGTSF